MAIRSEELVRRDLGSGRATEAEVLAFPTAAVRRRVTRQRRVAVARRRAVAASFLVVLVVGVLFTGGIGSTAPVSDPGAPRTVTVQAGDTLWDLARRYGPDGGDPRVYIQRLEELNSLSGAPQAGVRLKLPR